ncbi:MAG: tetratricopeptide repeat protein [Pyrinomonadaceae bacterium]
MAETTAQVKIEKVSTPEIALGINFSPDAVSIRVAPGSYFIAFFLTIFFTAFAVYLEQDFIAAGLFIFGFIILPFFAWNDRVVFDGEKISRRGIVPRLWFWLNRESLILKLSDIEQVETQAIRALKRGGSVFYRYRTSIQGKNKCFEFASGGEDYRRMIQRLFPHIFINALDNRSIELRDYLSEPKTVLKKTELSKIPSADVLESSINKFPASSRHLKHLRHLSEINSAQIEKANYLRRLANELRLSGNLLQSLEAFRRALVLNPFDAWLIFEFARCLHSYASSERSEKLQKRARAALRLAEIRAGANGELLARLGESYFQYGDWNRAGGAFQKALNTTTENFRSVRGLAEIALREGKIAHVIHHFTAAKNSAGTNALRRWTQGEILYFSSLNNDEDYMEAEVRRLTRLENIERGKKMALRLAVFGFLTILFGMAADDIIINVGWACASVSLLIWAGLIMTRNILTERSPIVGAKSSNF